MVPSANSAWLHLANLLMRDPAARTLSPRGERTKERLFAHTTFRMDSPICYHQNRKLNYAFAAAEAYAITHGIPDANFLVQYNKNMAQFSDDGLIFNGAYGPPFHNQLMYVVESLLKDQVTRQAVLTIWRQNPVTSRDIACTLALQFLIRDELIHTKVTMRSSDIWLGIPYDFENFTLMTLRVLTLYNERYTKSGRPAIGLGNMNWSAGSSHVYKHDLEKLELILKEPPNKEPSPIPERAYTDWRYVVDSLQACMNKDEKAIVENGLWRIRP